MPEPQKMVHLTPAQRRRKKFNHPLMDDAPSPLGAEQLNQLLLDYFETDRTSESYLEIRQTLVINYFRLLGGAISRYLYYWPVSRRLLDEMVSTGVESIVRIITELKSERLQEGNWFKSLGGLIDRYIRRDIEIAINDFRGIVPAPHRTNCRREQRGSTAIHGSIETSLTNEEVTNSQEYEDIDPIILEVKDTLKNIAKTDFERQILMDENWGLSDGELATKLGKGRPYILKVRRRLRERYDKLNGRSF
jgi:hypothetical protein